MAKKLAGQHTWQVLNFVVGRGKIVTARNFHATIKTAGEAKWVVIRELGNRALKP
jgi:hypothetical protein